MFPLLFGNMSDFQFEDPGSEAQFGWLQQSKMISEILLQVLPTFLFVCLLALFDLACILFRSVQGTVFIVSLAGFVVL